ncbi:hypothetical protein K1X84_13900 [bacterium]|nr:hypothetical protein [bacterium]
MNSFEELLVLLTKNKIKFVTVGGLACAFNGFVRPTEDVDILIDNEESNINELIRVLSGYQKGYAHELTLKDFPDEEGSVRIIELFPIDIFVRMSGFRYRDTEPHIKYFTIENQDIPYLDREMLVTLKSNSLRPQDQLDVQKLKSIGDD